MTFKYNNVFINSVATVAGKFESEGPLNNFFDKTYNDFYFGTKTWEDAECFLIQDCFNVLMEKLGKNPNDVDFFISGDLLNQLVASNYAASELGIPYFGIYNACATSVEGLIIAANMVEAKQVENCVCAVSSHNNAAEKQFRYPVEYGGPKPKTTTFTTTGSACAFLSDNAEFLKVESATVGSVIDMGVKDVYNMGAVMAPACASVIQKHLIDTNRDISYYDMVYSGDLGKYGKKILKSLMKSDYGISLKNYDDTATMIFDLDEQPVYAGGSGPACLPLVAYSYIFSMMRKKKLKKVLLVATGALMSPAMVNEKHTIPAIAHAISLEVL